MAQTIAPVHCRQEYKYSKFHLELLEEHKGKAYALAKVYNSANLRHLLVKEKLVREDKATNYFQGILKSERQDLIPAFLDNAG